MFELGKIVGGFFLPPGVFILVFALAAILTLRGKRRSVIALCAASAVLLYALSLGPVANLLVRPLEDRYPPLADASSARAVVVLGGGYIEGSPAVEGRAVLSPASAARATHGARLALESGLPVLYSGGSPLKPAGSTSEADVAVEFLVRQGVPADRIIREGMSRDTFENAILTAAMGSAGAGEGGPVALVTSAYHMPRSVLAFRKAGVDVLPAPTDYWSSRGEPVTLASFLPSALALELSYIALHEYVGLAYYSLR